MRRAPANADDHLSLVAGVSKLQIEELRRQGVATAAALAAMPVPLSWKPSRGAAAHMSEYASRPGSKLRAAKRESCSMNFSPVASDSGLPAFRRRLQATSF